MALLQQKVTSDHLSNIVICLGPGRSGTSLAMNLMVQLGVRCNDSMIPASEHNPDGTWEDQYIFNRHSLILKILQRKQTLPIRIEEFKTPAIEHIVNELEQYVAQQLQNNNTPWGFKDPRTSLLLPAWQGICHKLKILPKYVLCIRHPADSIASLMKNYGFSQEASEQLWLGRTLGALKATGGNVFIVHYEEWFEADRFILAKNLCRYLELPVRQDDSRVEDLLNNTVKNNLNRSKWDSGEIKNVDIKQSYELLKAASGADYDREAIMEHAISIMKRLEQEQGPVAQASDGNRSQSSRGTAKAPAGKQEQRKQAQVASKLDKLTKTLEAMDVKINDLSNALSSLNEIISQKDQEITNNQQQIAALESQAMQAGKKIIEYQGRVEFENKQAQRIEQLIKRRDKLGAIESSLTFQIALAANQAIFQPGIKTLLLPWTILKLCIGGAPNRTAVITNKGRGEGR